METNLLSEFPELSNLESPSEFSKTILGFTPYYYQMPIINSPLHELKGSLCKAGRRSGKTQALAIWSVIWATRIPMNIFVLSPSDRQSSWFRQKIKQLIYHSSYLPFLKAIGFEKWITKDTEDSMIFSNGSTLTTLPCPPDARSIRGLGFDSGSGLIIVDESAQIPSFVLDVVRASTLKGQASICYCSTPRGEQGQFYDTYKYFLSQIKKGDEGYKIFEFNAWDAIKAGQLTREKIEAERNLLSADMFRQEILGEFISEFGRVFDPESIAACCDGKPEPPDRFSRYAISGDLGYELDPSEILTWRLSRDMREMYLVDAMGFINAQAKAKEPKYAGYVGVSSYIPIRDYLVKQSKMYPTVAIMLDSTNQSILADTLLTDEKLPVEKLKFSRTSKPQMAVDLSAALRARTIHIWKGSRLEQQLYSYSYEMNEEKMRLTTITDNDAVDSAMLAVQYLQKHGLGMRPVSCVVSCRQKGSVWA